MERVRTIMEPEVRPFLDLQTNGDEISDYCHESGEPVFLTEERANGLVVMSKEAYAQMELYRLYAMLEEAEESIRAGRGIPAREAYEQTKAEMERWNDIA